MDYIDIFDSTQVILLAESGDSLSQPLIMRRRSAINHHRQLEHLGNIEALLVAATTAGERVAALQVRRQLLAEQEVVDVREQVPTGDHTEPQPSGRSSCTTFLIADGWIKVLLLALARRCGVRADVSHRLGEVTVALEGSEGARQGVEVEFDELVEELTHQLVETAREFVVKQVDSAIDERLQT